MRSVLDLPVDETGQRIEIEAAVGDKGRDDGSDRAPDLGRIGTEFIQRSRSRIYRKSRYLLGLGTLPLPLLEPGFVLGPALVGEREDPAVLSPRPTRS